MGIFSKDNQIWIRNETNETVYAVSTPNKDYVIADAAVTGGIAVITAICTLGASAPASGALIAMTAFRIVQLGAILNLIRGIGTIRAIPTKISQQEKMDMEKNFENIKDFFIGKGVHIEAGKTAQIFKSGYPIGGVLSPSGWAQYTGNEDYSLLIATQNFTHFSRFNVNSDHSWIVQKDGIVRAKYGTTDVPLRGEVFFRFPTYINSIELKVGVPMVRGDCIVSENGRYAFVFQKEDGNAVLYDAYGDKAIFQTDTSGKDAERLELQEDGNLVLYGKNKTVLRAYFKTSIPPEEKKGKRLIIQDDGNLALYNAQATCVWDSKHNAHVMNTAP